MFTSTSPEMRRVVPDDVKGRVKVKVVYVVLEAQYQSAISAAVKNINAKNSKVGKELHYQCGMVLRASGALQQRHRAELTVPGYPRAGVLRGGGLPAGGAA